jgi:hypothetical protein
MDYISHAFPLSVTYTMSTVYHIYVAINWVVISRLFAEDFSKKAGVI